jgi:hypothetical protein
VKRKTPFVVIIDTIVMDGPVKTSVTCFLEDLCNIPRNLASVAATAIGFPKYPHIQKKRVLETRCSAAVISGTILDAI